jgi:Fe-S oxidoreductase
MCNRCQEVCPAYFTGKELSPAAVEINKRFIFRSDMPGFAYGTADSIPLMDTVISESALWACTACGHCIDICPVGNTPMLDIMDIRRDQVLMASAFPSQLKGAFVGMERMGNPWQSTDGRMAWAEPLPFEVPLAEENPDYEYLLWVGCAGAFNPDAQDVTRAVATILHEAGVNFAVLGDAETCTGDSARRAGNEYLFYELAQGNIETLNAISAALAKAGATLLEMERSGKNSFCCGAGGAQYWKEEEHGSTAVNATRFAQAKATGATTLAVGCPFCATMMKDANREKGEPMQVKDVAQVVAEAMALTKTEPV